MGYGRTTTILLVAAIGVASVTGWRMTQVSAEVDDSRSLTARLRTELSEAHTTIADLEDERNEYRFETWELEDKLAAICYPEGRYRPVITLKPTEAQVGDKVRISGRCFLGSLSNKNVSHLKLRGFPQENVCTLSANVRGRAGIDSKGILRGHFVVPRRGSCDQRGRWMRPDQYVLEIPCGGCGAVEFEIERRPYWWIDSIEEAAQWVAGKVDVPVALPSLPEGAHLNWEDPIDIGKVGDATTATISLKLGPKRWLHLIYGVASIWRDGCEPPPRRAVDVNGQRALLTKPRDYKWSTIVWPVEQGSLEGHYGIDGSIRPKKALELARAMDLAISTTPVETEKDC
jgi:hypothetical protein